jgi:ABC-type amino acid transport substrate-binding protein|tara:strand:+ start:214 stop:927 length:714 start_codon:yes stop_codon:yes gene_type:complete
MSLKNSISNLILLCLLIAATDANSTQKYICATTHYPPYSTFDKSKKVFTGSDIDLIQTLFKRLEIDIEIVNLPWARLKVEIPRNNYDCFFSLGKFPDREKYLDYTSIPTHVTKVALFAAKGDHNINLDLSNKTVGVHRGINLHLDIPSVPNLENATIHKLPSNDILFQMLVAKRVDVVITSQIVGEYLLQNQHPNFKVDVDVIKNYALPVYIAFRKGTINISKVNKDLNKIKNASNL